MTRKVYAPDTIDTFTRLTIYIIDNLLIKVRLCRKGLKMKSVQINLMLVISLTVSIVCFFLMDLFVEEHDETEPSAGCSIVSKKKIWSDLIISVLVLPKYAWSSSINFIFHKAFTVKLQQNHIHKWRLQKYIRIRHLTLFLWSCGLCRPIGFFWQK